MVVSYGIHGSDTQMNVSFGEKMLHLLEIEALAVEELKHWCLDKRIQLPSQAWEYDIGEEDLMLTKFLICLKLSNEQIESCSEKLNNEKQLLLVQIKFGSWTFDDIYDLDESHPLKSLLIELYMSNLFLKCGVACNMKEFIQRICSEKDLMKLLPDKKEAFPELFDKHKEIHVDLPWKYPIEFQKRLSSRHTLVSTIQITFYKWVLDNHQKLFRDVSSNDVVPRMVKVKMKWLEKSNVFKVWHYEHEDSQTSIALKKIKQRQLERQMMFNDQKDNLQRTDLEVLKLFDRNADNELKPLKENYSNNKIADVSEKGESNEKEKENVMELDLHNITPNSKTSESKYHDDTMTDTNHHSFVDSGKFKETGQIDYDLISSLNRFMFVPCLDDIKEAQCVLKLESPKPANIESKSYLRWILKSDTTNINQWAKPDSDKVDLEAPPIESKVTFKS